jgi:hypothetical protein
MVEKLVAPSYVFAHFPGEPRWHIPLGSLPGRIYLRGAVSVGGRPARISDNVIAQLALVPKRLADEQARQERKRRAREAAEVEARRVWPGVRAEVTEGTFVGQMVDVRDVDAGMARILTPLFGGREAMIEERLLRRVEESPAKW